MGIGTVLASLVSILVAIALVAGLAFGFIYLLKLWQDRSISAAEQRGSGVGLRFMRALPLGQAERLVLVEVGDEVLLLGVAAHGVTLLKSWPSDEAPVAPRPADDATATLVGQLADRFRRVPTLRRTPPSSPPR